MNWACIIWLGAWALKMGKPQDIFIEDGVFIVYTNVWTDEHGKDAHCANSSCSAAF